VRALEQLADDLAAEEDPAPAETEDLAIPAAAAGGEAPRLVLEQLALIVAQRDRLAALAREMRAA
jgi:hypothetical protein